MGKWSEGLFLDCIFCFLLSFLLLTVPFVWIFSALFAAAFHELGHILGAYLCGIRIRSVQIEASGAKIQIDSTDNIKELVCCASGPAASFLLCLFSRWIPRIAVCAFIQGMFNLIPVYPLDGGRILRCVLCRFMSINLILRVENSLELMIVICLFWGAVWLLLSGRTGLIAFFPFIILVRNRISRKIPCKACNL